MNIYYVNKKSKLKGPYDIKDYKSRAIIKLGDVCVRETETRLLLLFVLSDINIWSSCICVGSVDNKMPVSIGNSLLFSFDGCKPRKGNVAYLKMIQELFKDDPLLRFFENAIDILQYRRDYWDLDIFKQINETTPLLLKQIKQEDTVNVEKNNDMPTLFSSFLNDELRAIIIDCLSKGHTLHNIYSKIRESHPLLFRQSIKEFLKVYPKKSIYDKE